MASEMRHSPPSESGSSRDLCQAAQLRRPGLPRPHWNDATTLVIRGTAAMQMLWRLGERRIRRRRPDPGKDYGCTI